jgi:hypothetical protein
MKKSLALVSALVVFVIFSGLGAAQQETSRPQSKSGVVRQHPTETPGASPDVTSTTIAAAQIARVEADPAFKAALALLEEQGEVANLSSGKVLRSRSQPAITVYSFDVTMRGSGEAGEYATLVYAEQTGQPTFVYFDGNRTISREVVAPQPSQAARGCFSTHWGRWQVTATFCNYNFWCIFKGQQALYLTETRQKTCPNRTVQTQTRTVKVHCGC